jgi:hypothetical protein
MTSAEVNEISISTSFQLCLGSTTYSITSLHQSSGDSLLNSIPPRCAYNHGFSFHSAPGNAKRLKLGGGQAYGCSRDWAYKPCKIWYDMLHKALTDIHTTNILPWTTCTYMATPWR